MAGIVVFERDPGGLLSAVRRYDDAKEPDVAPERRSQDERL
jgi:hypothetical protein